MPISIKDPEADELARQLALQTGESITEAVKQALRERISRLQRARTRAGLADRLLVIGRRCAADLRRPADSLDHGKFFYDERGLPK